MAEWENEINIVRLHGRVPAVTGESSESASGLSPDGAAGVWTQQLSNPGTDTEPSQPCSRAKSSPSELQEYWPVTINSTSHNEY